MEAWNNILEGLASVGGDDPVVRGAIVLGTGLVALTGLGVSLVKGRKTRSRVNVDAPEGAHVEVRVGGK